MKYSISLAGLFVFVLLTSHQAHALVATPPDSGPVEPVYCTMDAYLCEDGTYVGRTPPDCRFVCPNDPLPPPQVPPTKPIVVESISVGDTVKVTTGPLRVRATPGGARTGTQQSGAMGKVIAGPKIQGSATWWKVDYVTGVDGWSTGAFLKKVSNITLPIVPTQKFPQPQVTLYAFPSRINPGESATLVWNSKGASRCEAHGGWSGSVRTSGVAQVTPTVTTKYALTCHAGNESTTKSTLVSVAIPVSSAETYKPVLIPIPDVRQPVYDY